MTSWHVSLSLILSASAIAIAPAAAASGDGPQCFSRDETREHIRAERLVEPFAVLRTTARAMSADALGAKLCRTDGSFVYEINLLDRSGRVIHATVDAATGKRR